MPAISMTPDSEVYKKLQRLERLLELKKRVANDKEEAKDFLIKLTQPLKDAAAMVDIDIDIDQPLAQFLTKFDEQVVGIEQELLQMTA